MNQLRTLAASSVVALLAAAAPSQALAAYVTPWGPHGELQSGGNFVLGTFTGHAAVADVYTFTLAGSSNLLAQAHELYEAAGSVDLSNASVQLFMGAYGDATADTSLGAFSFNGTANTNHRFLGLAAGSYYYLVTGDLGPSGGNYMLASAATATAPSPVPEPQSLALSLAGLGLLGAMARRRKID